MPEDDYWERDELQDRRYYEKERAKQSRTRSRGLFVLRRIKPSTWIILFLVLLLWWSLSGEKPVKPDWSKFAYSQYTTDTHSLCNALMVFESLHKTGSQADRVLLYPQQWVGNHDVNRALMHVAEKRFKVKLQPIEMLSADGKAEAPGTLDKPSDWNLSLTKLRVFDLIQYDRILHLDSDITLMKHMDELFTLPKTPIAMPRSHWSDGEPSTWSLTSLIMLLEPNTNEIPAMMQTLRQWQTRPENAKSKRHDTDLLTHRFGSSAMVLPNRPYTLSTAEFRKQDHRTYLGYRNANKLDSRARWDPDKALKEAKLVHFNDSPLPPPWIMWPISGLVEIQPDCGGEDSGTCREREIWKNLYQDFRKRRKNLCKILSVPAPDWEEWKNKTNA